MTRKSKIARLPDELRDEVNERLRDGEPATSLLEWLNGLPAVKKLLKAQFDGMAISPQNLSEWRQGGYVDWLECEERVEMVGRVRTQAASLQCATAVTEGISGVLSAELSRMTVELLRDCKSTQERWDKLRELLPALDLLRRGDHRAVWARVRENEWNWKLFMRDEEVATEERERQVSPEVLQRVMKEIRDGHRKQDEEKRDYEMKLAKKRDEEEGGEKA